MRKGRLMAKRDGHYYYWDTGVDTILLENINDYYYLIGRLHSSIHNLIHVLHSHYELIHTDNDIFET